MTADAARARASLDAEERALLASPARPIVLVRRRAGAPVAPSVAPGSPWLGVHAAVHAAPPPALRTTSARPLVMTSGNLSDEPIAFDDDEARARLGAIADAFLAHDRPIHRRCEDSVVRARRRRCAARAATRRGRCRCRSPSPRPDRRGRRRAEEHVLRRPRRRGVPLGRTSATSTPRRAYRAFRADLALYLDDARGRARGGRLRPAPRLPLDEWAREQDAAARRGAAPPRARRGVPRRARPGRARRSGSSSTAPATARTGRSGAASCCAATSPASSALAHLEPVPLPGGEAAIREPWRDRGRPPRGGRPARAVAQRWPLVRESLTVNAPLSSGMGRLFDAVAALLGVREQVSYEGQAAIELEHLAGDDAAPSPYGRGASAARPRLVAARRSDDLAAGRPRAEIAAAFHEGSPPRPPRRAREAAAAATVVLSGGCFQNLRLLGSTARAARGGRLPRARRTGSCRRTTAASATARRPSPRGGSPCA